MPKESLPLDNWESPISYALVISAFHKNARTLVDIYWFIASTAQKKHELWYLQLPADLLTLFLSLLHVPLYISCCNLIAKTKQQESNLFFSIWFHSLKETTLKTVPIHYSWGIVLSFFPFKHQWGDDHNLSLWQKKGFSPFKLPAVFQWLLKVSCMYNRGQVTHLTSTENCILGLARFNPHDKRNNQMQVTV